MATHRASARWGGRGRRGAPAPPGGAREGSAWVTLGELVRVLRLQVSTAECGVFAYASLEGDVVVLVMAVTEAPTKLQV